VLPSAAGSAAPTPSAAAPVATPPASAAARGKGSIEYQITGGFTDSGELPYAAHPGSYFSAGNGGGWLVLFANDPESKTDYLWLRTRASGQEIQFGKGGATLDVGSNLSGKKCKFELTKNDASGLRGSAACTGVELWKDKGQTVLDVTFRAQWDAQP
jgi:hypothetical protein